MWSARTSAYLPPLSGEKVEGVKTVRPLFPSLHGFEMMRKMRNWAVPKLLPVVVTGLPAPGVTGFSPCSYTLTTLRKREVGDALTKLSWCGELRGLGLCTTRCSWWLPGSADRS